MVCDFCQKAINGIPSIDRDLPDLEFCDAKCLRAYRTGICPTCGHKNDEFGIIPPSQLEVVG